MIQVTGACHCGKVQYQAEVDPARVSICNCTDCQVLSGTAFRVSAPTLPGTFRMRRGTVSVYVKTAESGSARRHAFCPACGSPVWSSPDTDDPESYNLRVGCLDQKAALVPKRQIWCRSALPWAQDVSVIPSMDQQ